MKLALISDVHANVVALHEVLRDIDRAGAGRILCAGDVVGYYPYPNETVQVFQERGIFSIQGNHDRSVLSIDTSGMNPWARSAVLWTARHLDPGSRQYLQGLRPHSVVRMDRLAVGIYHGSPRDDDEYIFPEEVDEELINMTRCDIIILGHTHIPFERKFGQRMIINPGSVGQPRDGDPRASWTLLDTITRKAENRRVGYDIEAVARKVEEEGLPIDLAKRLFSGY